MNWHFFEFVRMFPALVAIFLTPGLSGHAAGDRIILRDLEIIKDARIASFDEDGVRVVDNRGRRDEPRTITWDEIERISLDDPARQQQAEKLLSDLGDHLYRIRQRLSVGDYQGLHEHAEAVYPRYENRRSQTAYMVCQAVMWSRLAAGKREAALAPYFRCYELLRDTPDERVELPGRRRLKFRRDSGICLELLPIWFDADAAREQMPPVLASISAMKESRPPAARVYFGTLALAAGETARGLSVLEGAERSELEIAQLYNIALVQAEVAAGSPNTATNDLEASLDKLVPHLKPLAWYWLGRAKLSRDDPRQRQLGALYLLQLPANYGKTHAELAGAALYQVMQYLEAAGNAAGNVAVRNELLGRFGHTYFAGKVRDADAAPARDDGP